MTVKYGECNIVCQPIVTAQPTRMRGAEVRIDAAVSCDPQTAPAHPITVTIKGKHIERVLELLGLNVQSDADLAALARGAPFADEVAGMDDAECAAWVRESLLAELIDLADKPAEGGGDD
jgi:hypothetical protein